MGQLTGLIVLAETKHQELFAITPVGMVRSSLARIATTAIALME